MSFLKCVPLLVLVSSLTAADDLEKRLSVFSVEPTKVLSNDLVRVKLFTSQNEIAHIKTVVESVEGRLHSTWESGEMEFENPQSHEKWTEEVDDVVVYWPIGSKRLNVRYFNRSIETSGKGLRISLWDSRGKLELQYSNHNFKNFSAQVMDGVKGATPLLNAGPNTQILKGAPNGRFVAYVVDPHWAVSIGDESLNSASTAEDQQENRPTDLLKDGLFAALEGFVDEQKVEGALRTAFRLESNFLAVKEAYNHGTREGVTSLQLFPFDISSLKFEGGKAEGRTVMFPIFSENELMTLGSGDFKNGLQVGAWEQYGSWEYQSGCWLNAVDRGLYVEGKKDGRWISAIESHDCGEPNDFSKEEFWDRGKWIEKDAFIKKRQPK